MKKVNLTLRSSLEQCQVDIPHVEEVEVYLAQHSRLGELLPMICNALRQSFGPDVELSLEVYQDQESDERYLSIYVRPRQYTPELMDQIEAISSQFDQALDEASGYLLVTTDFKRPQHSHAL